MHAYGYKKVLNPPSLTPHPMQFRNIDRAYRFTRAHNRHPELSVMEVFTLYSVYYLSRNNHASLKNVTEMMSINKRSCTNGTLTKLRDNGYIIKHKFGITPVYTLTPLGSYYLFSLENTLKSLRVDR
jgi:Mn-dependent DtxR family transcriptional regulator